MAGCYIHIPFCSQKCSYCDFHFSTNQAYRGQMVEAIQKELTLRAKTNPELTFQTIYFGGGTPSILSPEQLESIIQCVYANYHLVPHVEITVEVNPENCTTSYLESLKKIGVSRLSIGVQSFNDKQLLWMNRSHQAADSIAAIQLAQTFAFDEISVDLMYGLPGMDIEEWTEQLMQLIQLHPHHISAYCLTVEPKTSLYKWVKEGKIHPADSEQQAEQFKLLVDMLQKHGYEQYEISNFCRDGHYSKHNTSYWKGEHYLGIGPSAHGYNGMERYWNVANNHQYLAAIQQNKLPETVEQLSKYDRFNEALLIGLRTKWGVDKNTLSTTLPISNKWYEEIEKLKEQELLIETDSAYILSQDGRLLADGIASDLFILED